jgi:phosphodiesterase/alkaline phosphatase D-like protein
MSKYITLPICALVVLINLSATGLAQAPATPELPRVYLDTTYTPTGGQPWVVTAGADLQAVINQAQPGDTILLQAGATFTGNFTLPPKPGAAFITLRTSTPDELLPPQGTRLTPAHAPLLARLLTPGPAPALKALPGAHHYRLLGLELGLAPSAALNYGIVEFGASGAAQNAPDRVPTDLIVDRCWIHGTPGLDVSRGVLLNSARTAVVDSTISEVHGQGFDTQALCGWNGPGPFKIVNNFLEAAGENVMFGGADTSIADLTPSDIEIRGNHFYKPLRWNFRDPAFVDAKPAVSGAQHWTVKNLLELKHARRVLVEGNLFENHWVDAQAGPFLLLTPRNQDGANPWAVVEDVTIQHNWVRNVSSGIHTSGHDDIHTSRPTARVLIRNNVMDGVGGGTTGGDGRVFKLISGTDDLVIEHNTVLNSTGMVAIADGPSYPHPRFVFRDNLVPHNEYGFFGSGTGSGNGALATYFPGAVFTRNALYGPQGSWGGYTQHPGNTFANGTTADGAAPVAGGAGGLGFEDLAGRDLRLTAGSPFKGRATDGTDMGVQDAAAVKAAADAARSGTAAGGELPGDETAPTISGISTSSVSETAATISWFTNEESDSLVEYGLTPGCGTPTAPNAVLQMTHSHTLAGLQADTTYYYRVRSCDSAGNAAVSGVATFRTDAADTAPPAISGVVAGSVTTTGATITWVTDEASDTQVEYGITAAFGSVTALNPAMVTAHSQALSGLQPDTVYFYRVRSRDRANNPAVSQAFTFRTGAGDTTAPVIAGVSASSVTTSGATIVWATDEAGDTQVEYGLTPAYGGVTALNAAMVMAHTQALGGLQADTVYNYRVRSRDEAGNLAVSPNFTFRTAAAQPPPPPPPAGTGTGLTAQYYNDPSTGARFTTLALTRTDATVNFNWGERAPAAGVQPDAFSVRWTGQVQVPVTGNYKFTTASDDGVRLWVNNQLVIDNWTNHATTTNSSVPISLTAGQRYDIKMEYYDAQYGAVARLGWALPGQSVQVIPQSQLYPSAVAPTDTTAPTITAVASTSVTASGATVSWATNEASDTQVEYGLTTAYGSLTTLNTSPVTSHTQTIGSLQPDTAYNYRVRSRDAAGNLAVSPNFTFRTAAAQPPATAGTGLTAQYYNDPSTGSRLTTLALTRVDPTVDFNWGEGVPAPGVQAENFSVRWTGQVQAPATGAYTFSTVSDDGVRLWINNQLVIDNWTNHAATTNSSAPIVLTAGVLYDIRMEYYDSRYGAVARLLWSFPGQAPQIIPQSRLIPAP